MPTPKRPRETFGFTLIELLAVLAVVANLAAILLPVISKIRTTGQASQTAFNMRSLLQATQLWSQDNDGLMPNSENGYPSSLSGGRAEDLNYLFPYGGKNMVGFVDGSVTQMTEPEFMEKMEEISDFRTSAFWTGTGS